MIGGFGTAGSRPSSIDALIAQGARDLTIVNNNAGNGDVGLAALLKARRVRKIICSFPAPGRFVASSTRCTARARSSSSWCRRATSPSGSAPRAPASARSSRRPATARCSPKARRRASSTARDYVLEYPIHADFALIKADRGDRWGNLVYRKTARNFGPIMACGREVHGRAGARGRGAGRARSGGGRDARHLRAPGRGGARRGDRRRAARCCRLDSPASWTRQ